MNNLESKKELGKLEKIKQDGLENLQVVLDFDRTITGPTPHGRPAPSMISFLRESDILGEEYFERANALFAHYHPIEISNDISLEEKNSLMHEWWVKHIELLIEYKLTLEQILEISSSPNLVLRDGAKDFFLFCSTRNIPIIIFSANVLGSESISNFLKMNNVNYPNIKIITNELTFNEQGEVVNFKEPIIHSENKNETILDVEKIMQRKNTILAGDGLADANMISDSDGRNVYRIVVNDSEDKRKFRESFDDTTNNFDYILSLIK